MGEFSRWNLEGRFQLHFGIGVQFISVATEADTGAGAKDRGRGDCLASVATPDHGRKRLEPARPLSNARSAWAEFLSDGSRKARCGCASCLRYESEGRTACISDDVECRACRP